MHRKEQIWRRLEQVQLFLEQQRVRAKRYELFPRHDAFDDLANFLVDKWLAARNGDHWCAALVDCIQAFLDRKPPIQNRIRVVDLATTEAGEIAPKQRLQHQHQWIALAAAQLLLEQICANANFLEK